MLDPLAQCAKGLLAQPECEETCGGRDDPGSSPGTGRPDRHAREARRKEQEQRSQRGSASSRHEPESREAVEVPGYTVRAEGRSSIGRAPVSKTGG
jgi:hypothetical protein